MTASLVNSKGLKSGAWSILLVLSRSAIENMMCSKVYTCKSESVLANFVPFFTLKFKSYNHDDISDEICVKLADQLKTSKEEAAKISSSWI
ncbi:endoribonuclease Dicer homolog 2-like [Euphorbia lathyris]|uniref:endoribonuclease Dicer homolog 2-like n=1 Tax=Euphorbia lathyris TaxID=212925 RepID=UPI003313BA08